MISGVALELRKLVICMRRTDLEAELAERGWVYLKAIHGHRVWRHPRKVVVIAVPDIELLFDSVGTEILESTER